MSFTESVKELWARPAASYRSAPFWSWNSNLKPHRLTAAIDSMSQAGMGGFFMHSRYGLKTPYLSPEWFQCVSACIEKARSLQMKAYLYDEDRWPSGAAGGLVTRTHPEFRSQAIMVSSTAPSPEGSERIASFAVELDDAGQLESYKPAEEGQPLPPGCQEYRFDLAADAPSPWYNDGAYLDTMNADAVAEFIHTTHQAYSDRYGKDFGGVVPAIFTDEPNYGRVAYDETTRQYRCPWTADLPREFRRRRGYDLREHLPELVFMPAGKDFSKVRHDYFQTITELFVENYSAQVGKWAGKHRIASTGHMLWEETLETQVSVVGAAMPHYEHMQWPGIDILCDQANELSTAKQCSSVASQLGKERVLSELYGCTGWDWPMEGHKFIGDWHLATGINLRCPHLTHYSLQGGAKRDYPASIFSHSPWWPYYRQVEDYFARLTTMLLQGKPVRDVLVIHPVQSAWGMFDSANRGKVAALNELQAGISRIISTLSGEHYDWDFGDESLLARHAKVSGDKVHVGKMAYELIVVPPTATLRASTLALLKRFIEGGGKVLFVGRMASCVDAAPSDEVAKLTAHAFTAGVEEFLPQLETMLQRRVSITEGNKQATCVWAMLRAITGGHLLFVQSHDRRAGHRVNVSVAANRPVVLWDARTGRRIRVKSEAVGNRVEFELDLPSTGSALVSLGVSVADAEPAPAAFRVNETIALAGPFDIELTEPNTFPLDYCSYRIGQGELSAPVPTLKADEIIRKNFGLGKRTGDAQQPWYLYSTGVVDIAPRGQCQLKYTFHATVAPAKCLLAIEQPEDFKITVNGQPAGAATGCWVDEDIRTIDIASLIRPGQNEVLLDFNYRANMELEALYLAGEFGVASQAPDKADKPAPGNMTLTAPVTQLSTGSWVGQGLDFYGAAVKYKASITRPAGRRVRISLPGIAATMAVIHVGVKQFTLPWAPFSADITDALSDGPNEITIEVVGGRKNILGPLHVPWLPWTGPGEFDPDHPQWTAQYQLTDHGLMQPATVELF